MLHKFEFILKLLTDSRLRKDIKAFKASKPEFINRAWNLLLELNLKKEFEKGISINSLKKKGIKNSKMLECMLDLLVGEKVLKFEKQKYFFVKEPKKITVKEYDYLKKYYPYSVKWADFVYSHAKKTLLTGKTPKKAGFDYEESLELWDGIMEETPYSFRVTAVKKLAKLIKENDDVLDLGCGGGIGLETIILNTNKKINLYGAEVSKKYLERSKKRIKKIEKELKNKIMKENINNLKLINYNPKKGIPKERKYNAIFMSIVLNHIPEKERSAFFKEVKEILKPKGHLIIFQLIHQSKFKRNPICWLMHVVPTHSEYPFRKTYVKSVKKEFRKVKELLNGVILIAQK